MATAGEPPPEAAEASVWIQMLGAVDLRTPRPDHSLQVLAQPKRLGLLCYLASTPGRAVRRDELADLFWPELDRARGRKALRNALYFLREKLGRQTIPLLGEAGAAADPRYVQSDVARFEAEVAAGRWERAVAAHQGEFLLGLELDDAEPFAEWVDRTRTRLRTAAARAAWAAAEQMAARGAHDAQLRYARHAVALVPDDELGLQRLLRLLISRGDRAGAVAEYQTFRTRLLDRFGEPPDPATERILSDGGGPSAAPAERQPPGDHATAAAYQRGVFFFLRAAPTGSLADLEESRAFFETMLVAAPESALALAGLANYYALAAARGRLTPFSAHFGRAIELSERALALDASLAIPHVHFGVKAMYLEGDWPRAGQEFGRAVALEPWYAEARRFFGVFLQTNGQLEEAITEFQAAVSLEPRVAWFHNALATALMEAERLDEAATALERALALEPNYRAARDRLIRIHERRGAFDRAVVERTRGGDPLAGEFETALATGGEAGYRARSREERLRWISETAARLDGLPPTQPAEVMNPIELRLALAFLEVDDAGAALRWIERGCRNMPARLRWIAWLPETRSIRSHPRFRAVAAAAGITP